MHTGEKFRRSDHIGVQDDICRASVVVAEVANGNGDDVGLRVESNGITGMTRRDVVCLVGSCRLHHGAIALDRLHRRELVAQSDGARAVAAGDLQRGHDDRFVILTDRGSLAGSHDSQKRQHTAEACPPKNRLHAETSMTK